MKIKKKEPVKNEEDQLSSPSDELNDLNINGQTVAVDDLPKITASSMEYDE